MSTIKKLTKFIGEIQGTKKIGTEKSNDWGKITFEANGYCRRCGLNVHKGHSSETFWKKKSGHKLKATSINQIDGN